MMTPLPGEKLSSVFLSRLEQDGEVAAIDHAAPAGPRRLPPGDEIVD